MATPRTDAEQRLLDLAHQVLAESRQLMLPHHQNVLGPRLQTFDEMQIHDVNVTGVNKGRFKTNLLLLYRTGQRPTLTAQQQYEDVVIIDLTAIPADIDSMRRILLTTELHRHWHHAPWLAINLLKKGKLCTTR